MSEQQKRPNKKERQAIRADSAVKQGLAADLSLSAISKHSGIPYSQIKAAANRAKRGSQE